jgi:hypothetical protein
MSFNARGGKAPAGRFVRAFNKLAERRLRRKGGSFMGFRALVPTTTGAETGAGSRRCPVDRRLELADRAIAEDVGEPGAEFPAGSPAHQLMKAVGGRRATRRHDEVVPGLHGLGERPHHTPGKGLRRGREVWLQDRFPDL